MARRVILNSATFKVSKPGYDAHTAIGNNLLIDTRNFNYCSVILQGTIGFGSFTQTVDDPGYSNAQWQYTLNFGQTFDNPPICWVNMMDQGASDGTCISSVNNFDKVFTYDSATEFGYVRSDFYSTNSSLIITVTEYDPGIPDTYKSIQKPTFFSYAVMRTS